MTASAQSLPIVGEKGDATSFARMLHTQGISPLVREQTRTLQVNVGKLCNQACHHCHVEAGPKRTEIMPLAVAERHLQLLAASPNITTVDLTGGAPELNPSFHSFVIGARALGKHVIDRCNLTVFYEAGMDDLPEFLAAQRVEIVASLPCYTEDNVDKQRGKGVYEKSLRALKKLNSLGYGIAGSGLDLTLVYNPGGAFLPPQQDKLEARYRQELRDESGIEFSRLFTITNMPIKRFAHALARDGQYETYMSLLVNHFNPATVPSLMCRSSLSVSWDGRLYDCDFNQMLELETAARVKTIWDLESYVGFAGEPIATASHCFGCTAGAGSSCQGAIE